MFAAVFILALHDKQAPNRNEHDTIRMLIKASFIITSDHGTP